MKTSNHRDEKKLPSKFRTTIADEKPFRPSTILLFFPCIILRASIQQKIFFPFLSLIRIFIITFAALNI